MHNIVLAIVINIVVAIIIVASTQVVLKRLLTRKEEGDPVSSERLFDLALTCSEYEQTSGGRLPNYFDTDQALTRDPDVLSDVSTFIADILGNYPSEKICFVEKDSGPIGALLMSGLISFITRKPMSIIRTRRDVVAMSLKGLEITTGDNVVLIQDVVTTGFQIVLAAKTIERLGGRIVAVISVYDREEEKLPEFLKLNVALYSYRNLSSSPVQKILHDGESCHLAATC